jgi:hypothetical protein
MSQVMATSLPISATARSRRTHTRIETTTFGPQTFDNETFSAEQLLIYKSIPEQPEKAYFVVIKGPDPGIYYDFR